LRRLSNAFTELIKEKSLKCLCFFETQEVRYKKYWWSGWKGIHIVNKNSASGDFPKEMSPVGLDNDHLSICRLKSRDALLYGNVQKFIQARLSEIGSTEIAIDYSSANATIEPPPANKVQITKLPHTNSHLFGRSTEIAMLDRAWEDGCNILVLKAMGGTGKTALLKHWLDQFVASNYRGAKAVFTWSFYSQGSAENKQTSTEDFFESAFRFFGYTEQNLPPPHERGIKLAQLVMAQRTLLILDGLEPLQHPVGIFHGELKDQGLKALLQQLAVKNPGLCLISSRQTVEELKGKPTNLVLAHDLDHLQDKDGVALLRAIGVKGSEVELTKAVKELTGHALALNLLGNYVKKVFDGDIRQRDKIPGLIAERNDGKHAEKMLAAYETHLKGTPALSVLYLLGLFDRPVSPGAIQCLKEAKISELTDQLGSDTEWCYAIDDLREQQLLNAPNPEYPDNLDCHPLIREYFGKQLQTQQPQAWQQAHKQLYEYYKALPSKKLPDTLEEMQPLFSAVAHGCAAGLHQQALEEVYWPRIKRKQRNYLMHKLGGVSDDLATVAHFFTTPWHAPTAYLTEVFQGAVLSWAGYTLRALGRLREAQESMQAACDLFENQENWMEAANNASNLSELQLILGGTAQAVESGARGSRLAVQSDNKFEQLTKLTTHADALHQAGDTVAALALFREAEQLQKKDQPEYPYLYSSRGFRYCDLLLAQGNIAEVLKRYEQWLAWRQDGDSLLDRSLEYLTLGRAQLQQRLLATSFGRRSEEEDIHWLEQAVAGLRAAGTLHSLPLGLLARAALHRHTNDFPRARVDLQEVFDIADGSGMRLHLTDYHLEMARLLVAEEEAKLPQNDGQDRKELLQQHVMKAGKLIHETGYHRRDKELADLQVQVNELQKKQG
jgi:tetratricopeptide (TPR) repeat protein